MTTLTKKDEQTLKLAQEVLQERVGDPLVVDISPQPGRQLQVKIEPLSDKDLCILHEKLISEGTISEESLNWFGFLIGAKISAAYQIGRLHGRLEKNMGENSKRLEFKDFVITCSIDGLADALGINQTKARGRG